MKTETFLQAPGSRTRKLHRQTSDKERRFSPQSRAGWIVSLILLLLRCCTQAEPIACGQTINSSLSSAGESKTYTFDAAAGETVDVLTLSQDFSAVADVIAPGESRLG